MSLKSKIWIVDDERIVRVTLADDLRDAGFEVLEFSNANAILTALSTSIPEIIITDLKMPGMDGVELLKKVKQIQPEIFVIMMTAYGTVRNAVNAMKSGAYDYITKPFIKEEILLIIQKIFELHGIRKENIHLRKQLFSAYDFSNYQGDIETNKRLFDQIQLIANKDTTVLITGETGTGKELVTNIIHYNSNRKNKPFIKVSCAILSREIFESELFGHVKGAFTGADNDKQGRFELANNGTLYLDDIDDIPLDLQVNLLRVLEQREIEKVGSSVPIPINIRLIVSTKEDLYKLVQDGKFREDLYYRLNIFPINLLPLRERKTDIKKIFTYYYLKFSKCSSVNILKEAMDQLINYQWPGNVRELKNIAERLAIISEHGYINVNHIPMEMKNNQKNYSLKYDGVKSLEKLLADVEINAINCALESSKNIKSKAAEILGIPPSTLRTKMNKYNID